MSFLLIAAGLIALAAFLGYKLGSVDSDFSLYFLEKFGRPLGDLKGKVVWITGASSGIGQHLAIEMASHGCKLVLSDVDELGLERTRDYCKFENSKEDLLLLPFDMKETEKHHQLLEKILNYFGRVDIYVHNAGRAQRSAFHEIEINVDRELFEINVFGGVNIARQLVRHWYSHNYPGHIVVTSSIVGKYALTNSASYTASKHALIGYYECLRNESLKKGIKVTIMCPGPTESRGLPASFTGKSGEKYGLDYPRRGKRIETARQAKLYAVAIANEMIEAWTSLPPFLWYCYCFQYFPTISKWFYPRFLADRNMALKSSQKNR